MADLVFRKCVLHLGNWIKAPMSREINEREVKEREYLRKKHVSLHYCMPTLRVTSYCTLPEKHKPIEEGRGHCVSESYQNNYQDRAVRNQLTDGGRRGDCVEGCSENIDVSRGMNCNICTHHSPIASVNLPLTK